MFPARPLEFMFH